MLRRPLGMFAVILGGTVCLYSVLTTYRFRGRWPTDWPRSFPYPDHWLLSLNDYYDVKYPVTGPYIKLHGEWDRVMRDVSYAMWSGGVLCVLGLALILLPIARRAVQSRKRGFDVVSHSGGDEAAD